MKLPYSGSIQASHLLEADLQSLLQGVAICISHGYSKVILKGDSLILVDSITEEVVLQWYFMFGWKKLLELLVELDVWEIKHWRRSDNRVVDALAKLHYSNLKIVIAKIPKAAYGKYQMEWKVIRASEIISIPNPAVIRNPSSPRDPTFDQLLEKHARADTIIMLKFIIKKN